MHGGEDELVHGDGPVLAADRDVVLLWPRPGAPYPVLPFGDRRQPDALLCAEGDLPVGSADAKVLAVAEVGDGARVEAEFLVLAKLRAAQLVVGQGPVPASDSQDVVLLLGRWVPGEAPHRRRPLDEDLLHARLVSDGDVPVVLPQREVLPVWRPRLAENLGGDLVLGNALLLWRPEAKVGRRCRRQLLRDGVVAQADDAVVVAVLEDPLSL
mmetsp:Transcript_17068/g.40718  ORF Transcript_17068/g.40718 Transcript_17068/m.40718 type:complete len:212 (-) Transcript_17068:427-1062(-)